MTTYKNVSYQIVAFSGDALQIDILHSYLPENNCLTNVTVYNGISEDSPIEGFYCGTNFTSRSHLFHNGIRIHFQSEDSSGRITSGFSTRYSIASEGIYIMVNIN